MTKRIVTKRMREQAERVLELLNKEQRRWTPGEKNHEPIELFYHVKKLAREVLNGTGFPKASNRGPKMAVAYAVLVRKGMRPTPAADTVAEYFDVTRNRIIEAYKTHKEHADSLAEGYVTDADLGEFDDVGHIEFVCQYLKVEHNLWHLMYPLRSKK